MFNKDSFLLGSYVQADAGPLDTTTEKRQELIDIANGIRPPEIDQPTYEELTVQVAPSRERRSTETGRLLDRLEHWNASDTKLKNGWLLTLREIVDLGSEAVPELIEELDFTSDDRMLQCLGFLLRAIGDQRAVPALIRAIPKTLQNPDPIWGIVISDPDLIKFAKAHAVAGIADHRRFGLQQAFMEICGALSKLTGEQFDERFVVRGVLRNVPAGIKFSREQYYEYAKNRADTIDSVVFGKVDLPSFDDYFGTRPDELLRTWSASSGQILESVFDPLSTKVFYDIDTDSIRGLPEKWRIAGDIESHLGEILEWAQQEGFDLMGTESISAITGKRVRVLQGIGLHIRELDPKLWNQHRDAVSLGALNKEGRPIVGLLTRRDPAKASELIELESPASFLITTADNTHVLLHVGVETKIGRPAPGDFFVGDPELNPLANMTGRRFSLMYLERVER